MKHKRKRNNVMLAYLNAYINHAALEANLAANWRD